MTRRIDRIHEQRRAEEAATVERARFRERLEDLAETEADRLQRVLGLPAGMSIDFSSGPPVFQEARATRIVGECPVCRWPAGDLAGHIRIAHKAGADA